MPDEDSTPPHNKRAENELRELRDGILNLASNSTCHAPMGGGITALGKFEPIVPDSRFASQPEGIAIDWLKESLNLRIRQGKYSSGAVFLPTAPDSHGYFRGQIITSHRTFGRIQQYQMQVKSKRPGQITISSPVKL